MNTGDRVITAFLSASHKGLQYTIIDDIDLFLRECDDLDSDFRDRYLRTFVPENWGTTPADFLPIVRTRIAQALGIVNTSH
ncbi:contact-dependent growth inhibition system immunity protein [Pseudescherichia sp.]|uniref:contact-dependent growth inhibition system immunity protein n=1 Tax=Pseudescherichia sp. TaxID=2055881 RepID=UPI0028A01790|nr:contact-dependent growth inhibition system immunity protein [Pseudescherichia sp.]